MPSPPTRLRIGLIGDRNDDVRAHRAIPKALELAARACGLGAADAVWLPTDALPGHAAALASRLDGLWCVPASPYASLDGALEAIRFARERGGERPFLGTCGGFQHALIEYARDVLGFAEADHAESSPGASMPLIAPLSCSLVGRRGTIRFEPGSRMAQIFARAETIEEYHCNFGLNSRYRSILDDPRGSMRITGVDESGEARAIELEGHPFFLATLFQPELSALAPCAVAHPLVVAFVRAAAFVSAPSVLQRPA